MHRTLKSTFTHNDQATHQRKSLKLPIFTMILKTFLKFGG